MISVERVFRAWCFVGLCLCSFVLWKACGCFALGLWVIATLCDGCHLLLMSVLHCEAFHGCFCALLCKLCACLYARARQTIICGVHAGVALNKFIISHWGRNQRTLLAKKREVRRSHFRIPRFLPTKSKWADAVPPLRFWQEYYITTTLVCYSGFSWRFLPDGFASEKLRPVRWIESRKVRFTDDT